MLLSRGRPDRPPTSPASNNDVYCRQERERETERRLLLGEKVKEYLKIIKKNLLLEVRRGQFRPWVTPAAAVVD